MSNQPNDLDRRTANSENNMQRLHDDVIAHARKKGRERQSAGAGAGASVGALLGAAVGGPLGAAIGGAVGGFAGYALADD